MSDYDSSSDSCHLSPQHADRSAMRRVTVEPLAFLFILTVFCEYTVVQEMIATRLCFRISNASSTEACDRSALTSDQKQQLSAEMSSEMMRYMAILSLCSILASLFTGSWSDLLGRKPLLLLPSAFGLLAELLFALCSIHLASDNILILVYTAAVFNGISGGSTTAMSSCFGYIADITDLRNRTKRITLLESSFFVGGFIGFNVGGQLLKHAVGSRFEYIFGLCFVLHLSIIAYTFTLEETRGPRRSPSLPALANSASVAAQEIFSLDHAKQMFATISRRRAARTSIILLCCSGFVSFLAMSVQMTLLFTFLNSNFNFDSARYSLFSGVNFLISGVFLIAVIPLLYRIWPTLPDAGLAVLGFSSKLCSLVNLGLCQSSTQVFAGLALFAFNEYTMPAIRSMLSKLVDEDERGKAFAFLGVCQGVCQLLGSIIFPAVYRSTLSIHRGIAFEAAGVAQLVPITLILLVHKSAAGNSREFRNN